jgi:hypothetical protein
MSFAGVFALSIQTPNEEEVFVSGQHPTLHDPTYLEICRQPAEVTPSDGYLSVRGRPAIRHWLGGLDAQ